MSFFKFLLLMITALFLPNVKICASNNQNLKLLNDPIFLLSYPRSGNTWNRYILEYFTGTGSAMITLATDNTIDNKADYPLLNSSKGIGILKTHFFSYIEQCSKKGIIHGKPTFVLIIRSPVEAIPRHTGNLYVDKKYFELLEHFDKTNLGKKHVIYYEDLIRTPRSTINELLNVLNLDKSQLDKFMNNYPLHRDKVLNIYETHLDKSRTRGRLVHFHARKYNRDQLNAFIQEAEKKHPNICSKYLNRYFAPYKDR